MTQMVKQIRPHCHAKGETTALNNEGLFMVFAMFNTAQSRVEAAKTSRPRPSYVSSYGTQFVFSYHSRSPIIRSTADNTLMFIIVNCTGWRPLYNGLPLIQVSPAVSNNFKGL